MPYFEREIAKGAFERVTSDVVAYGVVIPFHNLWVMSDTERRRFNIHLRQESTPEPASSDDGAPGETQVGPEAG